MIAHCLFGTGREAGKKLRKRYRKTERERRMEEAREREREGKREERENICNGPGGGELLLQIQRAASDSMYDILPLIALSLLQTELYV